MGGERLLVRVPERASASGAELGEEMSAVGENGLSSVS